MKVRSTPSHLIGPLVAVVLLLGPAGAGAQKTATPTLEGRLARERQALAEVKKKLDQRSALLESSRAQERSLLLELEAADRQLAVIRTKSKLAARRMAKHLARTEDLEAEISSLASRLTRQRSALAKRLRHLYHQQSLTTTQVLLTAPSLTAAAERAKYMKRLARLDQVRITRYRDTLRTLQERKRQIEATTSKLTRARAEVASQAEALRQTLEAKRALLASIKRERLLHEQAQREMEAAAQDLKALITKLEKERETVRMHTAEIKRKALAGPPPFSLLKGRLPWPTDGRPLEASGRAKRLRKGVTIEAAEGGDIEAVAAGTVVFADHFRGYGNLCIIDHGASYHTLYAHALELTVRVGERVEAGQIIGRVGSSGAAPTPRLYFELRHRGRPIDPQPWMVAIAQ